MYLKLAFRNAKRSAGDYLLYVTTLVVLSALMMFSNLLAVASNQQGIQASSVPLIISMVMVGLLNYINDYMLRRRSKEFATYILLGMEKNKMTAVFFCESLLLSLIGLFIGMAFGSLCFITAISFLRELFSVTESFSAAFWVAALDSLMYFAGVQILSLLNCLRRMGKMQIGNLMLDGRKSQILKGKPRPFFWSGFFLFCATLDFIFICFITSDNVFLMLLGTNAIILPLVLGIWAFYKTLFHFLSWIRTNRRSELYQGSRLYLAAQVLSKITSNILLNTILSVCLLFSVMTFAVGFIVPNIPGNLISEEIGIWMSFVEICMCIVFIVIYFSILAVKQILETKENYHAFQLMTYLGKTNRQHKFLISQEIVLKYTLPTMMCLLLVPLCGIPLNSFLNKFLLTDNLLFIAIGCFSGCFFLMYIGYTFVAYKLCLKNVL